MNLPLRRITSTNWFPSTILISYFKSILCLHSSRDFSFLSRNLNMIEIYLVNFETDDLLLEGNEPDDLIEDVWRHGDDLLNCTEIII